MKTTAELRNEMHGITKRFEIDKPWEAHEIRNAADTITLYAGALDQEVRLLHMERQACFKAMTMLESMVAKHMSKISKN